MSDSRSGRCPDCDAPENNDVSRREFLRVAGAGAAVAASSSGALALAAPGKAAKAAKATAESHVQELYKTLTPLQKKDICFDWDHQDKSRGVLRRFVAANWQITDHSVNSKFFTDEQRDMIRAAFDGMINPDWKKRFDKQLDEDCGGFGEDQAIAIFGTPGQGKFEFVMSGRHLTLRCDGNSNDHVAFGGPIFYGHSPEFDEEKDHPGNVFWHQAVEANKLYKMLDGKQRKKSLLAKTPVQSSIHFRKPGSQFPGLKVTDMSDDQKEHLQKVLATLIEPYRQTDRDEAVQCLKKQGGLDGCSLAFYSDDDIGNDKVWDNWRLEGPAFVWHFRGAPHVHVWVNVADDPSVKIGT